MTRTASSASALQAAWNKLAPREQTLVSAAAAVVGLALLWWLLLAPALHTLRSAHTQHAKLDAQLQHMQALASEAQQLQAQPRTSPEEAARALQASVTATLGAGAKLALSGDRATLTLQGVQADALATWLAQARNNARAVPQEAHLTRSANPRQGNGAPTPTVRWDGTLVLSLPTR